MYFSAERSEGIGHVPKRLAPSRNPQKNGFFIMVFSYLIYSGLASNYCVLYSSIPLGMFRSATTYKVGKVNTFLGECLIKFKVFYTPGSAGQHIHLSKRNEHK